MFLKNQDTTKTSHKKEITKVQTKVDDGLHVEERHVKTQVLVGIPSDGSATDLLLTAC